MTEPVTGGGGPKPLFYLAVIAVVLGLVWLALSRFDVLPQLGPGEPASKPVAQVPAAPVAPAAAPTNEVPASEAPDSAGITTVKEYDFVPAQRLPEVKGVSGYKALENRTVRFAINVWAGWSPILQANGGMSAGKVWKTPGGQDFKVELVLIDDPVAMRDAFAAGDIQVGWATLDMLPLMIEGLRKDSRVMPRVYQQIDWSNGGDGIVVRDSVKTMAGLRGKKVVLAQNSPSHFFLLNTLINAGVQPSEVDMRFTGDAFQAAAAFNADKSIAGVVSWAPDIYSLSKIKGNKLIISTATANKLIADVWFARADFAKDHPDIIEGLARGIFDAMEQLKQQSAKVAVAKIMADAYSIPESDALGMLADAHSTNYAENREFFLNRNNPTNFERTWNTAYFLYKQIGAVATKTPFDQVMDFSVIQKLAAESRYADQKSDYDVQFAPASASVVQAESAEILTKTVVIHFYPNSWDLNLHVKEREGGAVRDELYDPNAHFVIEEVGKLAGQYGAARIIIEGHTDASMKGRVPASTVQELSANRANAVKQELVRAFPTLVPNQFSATGVGWDKPADENDPTNHAKNRRVEVKVYPAEAAE